MKLPPSKYRIMGIGEDSFYIEVWHWWWPRWSYFVGGFRSLTAAREYLTFWLTDPEVKEVIEVKNP